MMMHRVGLGIMICLLLWSAVPAVAQQYTWERLPATPALPKAEHSGVAAVNGIRLWYAVFGHGDPVILVHGGLANSDYWGLQVPVLARHYQVVVLDSRGHGRSTRTVAPIGYDVARRITRSTSPSISSVIIEPMWRRYDRHRIPGNHRAGRRPRQPATGSQ